MAFTRKWLAAMGIEAAQIEEIMTAHVEVVEGLKSDITKYKADGDELSKVRDQLAQAKNSLKDANEKLTAAEQERDEYKSKHDTATADLEKLKTETTAKETAAKREQALRAELKAKKYSDEAVSIIFDSKRDFAGRVEFGEDGNAKNLTDIMSEIESGYPQYTPKTSTSGANPATPPANGGGKTAITKDDIMKIKNTAERQAKIAENPELFGIK